MRLVVNGDGARLQHQAACVLHFSTGHMYDLWAMVCMLCGHGVGSIVERKYRVVNVVVSVCMVMKIGLIVW